MAMGIAIKCMIFKYQNYINMHKNFLKFYATFLFKTIDFKNVYVIIILSNTKGEPIRIGSKGKIICQKF
jgi:hypothetical protein